MPDPNLLLRQDFKMVFVGGATNFFKLLILFYILKIIDAGIPFHAASCPSQA